MSNLPKYINLSRFKSTFNISAEIGKVKKIGLNRLGLSKEDKKMRDIFIKWLLEENLEVTIDDVGNIYGKRQGKNKDLGSIMIGSHLDTQPNGGRFDGIVGVLAALEIIRTLNDYNIETNRSIVIVNFTTEEGARFGIPMEGSGVITGNYTKEYVYGLKDKDNVTFEQSLESIGYRGEEKNRASNVDYYLELHVEQGPVLEKNKKKIGVVQGVKGVTKFEVRLNGQNSHAAFPAHGRRDALISAAEMVLFIDKVTNGFEDMSTTVGIFEIYPSHVSMSTGEVYFTFDIRHTDDFEKDKVIKTIKNKLTSIADKNNIDIEVKQIWNMNSTKFSNEIIELIEKGANDYKYSYQDIYSGAGHDAKFMNDITKAGMIFTPSVEGLGHSPEEYTSFEDIEQAMNILFYVTHSLGVNK